MKFFFVALLVFALTQTSQTFPAYQSFPVAEGLFLAFIESLVMGALCAGSCLITKFPAVGFRNWLPGIAVFSIAKRVTEG
jgi:hypothetical protein